MPIMDKNLEKLVKDNLKTLNENIKNVKENEDKNNTFDVIASTEDVDRDWEIIKVDGWQTENWLKNPVVLANHYYTIGNIAWKGLEFYKDEEGRMRLKGVFSNNDMGKMAKDLYNGGFLKAVSVGFIVKQRNETDRLIIEKAELLEVSFVAVPCNAEAISMDWKLFKKGVDAGLLKEVEKTDEEIKEEEKNLELSERMDNIEKEFKGIADNIKTITDTIKTTSDDKDKTDDNKTDEKILQDFFKNLSKNVSSSLYQMKKKDK